jgi:hypothetical protein
MLYLKNTIFKNPEKSDLCSCATSKKIKILKRRSHLFFASCKMEQTGTDHLLQEHLLKPKLRGGRGGGGGGDPRWFSQFCPS